jgi:hypothetical protein
MPTSQNRDMGHPHCAECDAVQTVRSTACFAAIPYVIDDKAVANMGHPVLWLGLEVFGVLDGADFDVGLFAGFVAAEAGDPDLAAADHGSLRVDEEIFVFLFEDGVLNVVGDDVVVVLDEGLLVFEGEGLFAGVDFDGVVDEDGDGGGVVTGDGLLQMGEELLDLDVVSDG